MVFNWTPLVEAYVISTLLFSSLQGQNLHSAKQWKRAWNLEKLVCGPTKSETLELFGLQLLVEANEQGTS